MPGLAKGEEGPWEEWSSHCLKKERRMLVIKTSDTHHRFVMAVGLFLGYLYPKTSQFLSLSTKGDLN